MIRINLLPVRISKKKAAGKQQLVLLAVLVMGGYVGNLLWAQARAMDLKAREQKVAKTRQEIAQLDRIIGEVKNIKEQQAALREKLRILAELKAARSGPVRVMDAFATLTPKRLWITKVEEKTGATTITGQAVTIDDVSEFMSALKGDPHFGAIELKKTSAAAARGAKIDIVDFTLTTTISYAPKLAAAAAPAGSAAPAAIPAAAGAAGTPR
jgi:type IV pilus assembly protein PilN